MLEVDAAREIVLLHAARLAPAIVPLRDSLGRVSAESVSADRDSPPFDKSMMDGYAVRASDVSAGVVLRLVEEIPAGAVPQNPIGPGECSRIYTGAPIPDGADAVVMVERSATFAQNQIRIDEEGMKPGRNVIPRGKEMRAGEVIIASGTVLTPVAHGLLAAVGQTSVSCYEVPTVAVVSTGNEVVEAGLTPGPGQIRNSNGSMLDALVAAAGAVPKNYGIARDDETALADVFRRALAETDVLLITGGVSAGGLDLVPGVLTSLGVTTHFHKVRMKPGKPLLFGTHGGKLVFGLPGNPVSGLVGFTLFVRPALRQMAGHGADRRTQSRPLAEALSTTNDRPTYHPARFDGAAVRPSPWFGSADLRGLLAADALLVLPPGDIRLSVGESVDVIPL
jgi:molybdopterin molybdotransferase